MGFLYGTNDAAATAGIRATNSYELGSIMRALVRAKNKHGGLAARRIVPSYFDFRTSAASYRTELQAACAQFVQDDKVHVVISLIGFADQQFTSCLTQAGIGHVVSDQTLADQHDFAAASNQIAPIAVTVDRSLRAMLEGLSTERYLSSANRLGVVIEDCPHNQRAMQTTVEPLVKRLGLVIASRQTVRCGSGFSDFGPLAADLQTTAFRFYSDRVDRVFVVSAVESVILLLFANSAESQRYRPGYALTSAGRASGLAANVPEAQLERMRGVGWLPGLDQSGNAPANAVGRSCLSTLANEGIGAPQSSADYLYAFFSCDGVNLLERVLVTTRGDARPISLVNALTPIGTAFVSASTIDGVTEFRSTKREGPAKGRTFYWIRSCKCFRYYGDAIAL